jgi:hypothetical protein
VLALVSSGAALGQSVASDFYTVTPCRIYDSRTEDGPFAPGEQRELQVATSCGIPAEAVAVAANITAVAPTGNGNFAVFPDPLRPTATYSTSFRTGITAAAGGLYPLSSDGLGTLSLLASLPAGGVDLVLDVTGYFLPDTGGQSNTPPPPVCKTGTSVKAGDCWEGTVKLSGQAKNLWAYREARIRVNFDRPDPAPLHQSTYAYWDGGLNFTFRTSFPYKGNWSWIAVCETCDGRTIVQPAPANRTVTVDPRRQSPIIYSRGFLRVNSSGRFLEHQTGMKFFWLGDTAWAAPMRTASVANSGTTWSTYLTNRTMTPGNYIPPASAPTAGKYSVVQIALAFHVGAGGYTACTNGKECLVAAQLAAFTTTQKKALIPGSKSYWKPEYWRNLDRLVYEANEKGLVVVLTGVMDPFGGDKDDLATDDDLKTFARNLAYRMAGFFVIYSVGWDNRVEEATYACGSDTNASSVVNGFTKDTALVTKMNAVGSALDLVNHDLLITTHLGGATPFLGADTYFHDPGADGLNAPLASPYSYFHREPWLDFHLVQSGQCNTNRASVFQNGTCDHLVQEQQLACVMRRARTMPPKFLSLKSDDTPLGSSALVKPVINGEARYERTVPAGQQPEVPDIAYQSRHAGHVTTLSGASFSGGVYNVGEWRWPGDGMGLGAAKSPEQLKYLSILQEGQVMEWERLRRKEAMLRNAGTDENERSVVAVSESNQTIMAYLPHRDPISPTQPADASLKLAINRGIYIDFNTSRWSKKWWNPATGVPQLVTANQIVPILRSCENNEPTPCYTYQFNAPLCTANSRPDNRCDWVLLLDDLNASPSASGQAQLWSGIDASTGQWGVFAQQLLPTGEPAGPVTPVGDLSASVQAVPKVARDIGQQALAAWVAEDSDGEGFGIVARRLDESGLPVGDLIRVSDPSQGDQVSPSVASLGESGYVVTWTSYSEDNDQGEVYARYLDGDGNPLASQFQVNVTTAGEQGHSQVTSDASGNVLIAWESWGQDGDGNGVFARRFDASHAGSAEFQVYQAGAGWQYLAGLSARPAGGFEVRWQVYTPHGHDLGTWGQRIRAFGSPRDGEEFSVAGPEGGVGE